MATDLWPINLLVLALAAASSWTLVSAYRRIPDFPWRLVAIRGAILFIPAALGIGLLILVVVLLVYGGTSFAI